ncbi:FG-GAP-like repeat-containing protein [bacterium]
MLDYAEYTAWSAPGMSSGTGTEIIAWATIAENINSDSYTTDWGVDFSAATNGYNFISVRTVDNAGNFSVVATDVFYVRKALLVFSRDMVGPWTPGAVTGGDFDGDGDIDMVNEYLWLNDGTGDFATSTGIVASDLITADMDRDGDLDIVDVSGSGPSSIHWNNGSADFSDTSEINGDLSTWSMGVSDLDGDGDLDLVSDNGDIRLNDGSGHSFATSGELPFPYTGWNPTNKSITIADYDLDSDNDIVIIGLAGPVYIYFNSGGGSFPNNGNVPCSGGTGLVFSMDHDGDGDEDILFGSWGGPTTVCENDGAGVFSDTVKQLPSASAFYSSDFDADGDLDIVISSYVVTEDRRIMAYLNDGTGNYTFAGQSLNAPEDDESGGSDSMYAADFDADGDVDFYDSSLWYGSLWFNQSGNTNNAPAMPAPAGVQDVSIDGATTSVIFNWTAGSDIETPDADLLTYDIRVGTSSAGCEIYCAFFPAVGSSPWLNGMPGNVGATTAYMINLTTGTYYWSARTVDPTLKASAWSTEDSFTITGDTIPPVQSAWSPAKGSTLKNTTLTITLTTDENADCKWSLTDQAYSDMSGDCWNDGTTSIRCDMDGLSEGAEIVYTACRDEYGNEDTADSNDHIDYTVNPPAGTPSANGLNLNLIGSYVGGDIYDVFVDGDYAYALSWKMMTIIDISDPAAPVMAGFWNTARPDGIYVSGRYAYLADYDILKILDVSDPSSPSMVGYFDGLDSIKNVHVSGSYAYLSCGYSGLKIVDISDPSAPVETGAFDALDTVQGVHVGNGYAYIAGANSGLRIIDISDPSSPAEAGNHDTDGYSMNVFVSGNLVFLVEFFALRIIDASDPASPYEVGYFYLSSMSDIHVAGNYAYVAANNSGLQVIDVSDPASPSLAGSFDDSDISANGVFVSGNYAYLAQNSAGLRVIDVSDPAAPAEAGTFKTIATAEEVSVSGDYAYVTDREDGLLIFDVSTPSAPYQVGGYDTPGVAYGLYVSGIYAYVTDYFHAETVKGFHILWIEDPTDPLQMSFFETPGAAYGVFVSGDYAYVADGPTGLQIVDIKDKVIPVTEGFIDTNGAREVFVSGNYAYLANGSSGLKIIDISHPASPSETGSFDTEGNPGDIFVSGDYAYLAEYEEGLRIIDISDPVSPSEVGAFDTPGSAYRVHVHGNYAYVADDEYGLRVIDVSDPASPSEAGYFNIPGKAYGVTVSGDYVYVTAANSGLWILDFLLDDTTPPIQSNWNPAAGSTVTTYSVTITFETDENAWCRWSLADKGYDTMSDDCDNSGTTSLSCHAVGLENGVRPLYIACMDSAGNKDTALSNGNLYYSIEITTAETTPPTVTDNQEGDDSWHSSDPGKIFDVDFSDTGGSRLDYAQYSAWNGAGMTGTEIIAWTAIAENINSDSYTTDWDVDFGSFFPGTTYISVRAADNEGNISAVATDVFYVNKDMSPPSAVTSVEDGTGADIDQTISTTRLSANWAAGSDTESGIAAYWFAIGTSAGSTDVLDWTDNSTATGVTKTGLPLASGTIYYFSVKAKNGAGLFSNPTDSDGQMVVMLPDASPPADISYVYDGTGEDISTSTSATRLSANWAVSGDPESGIAAYWFAIGTAAGTTDVVDWTDNAMSVEVTESGLSLASGTTYYFSVRAENGAGLLSNVSSSDGLTATIPPDDTTPPEDISYVYDGTGVDIDTTTSATQLSANWAESSDPESGVAAYWFAIGTAAGATDIIDWTDNTTSVTVTNTGLSLVTGTTYYYSVKAENGEGLFSNVSSSDGLAVWATAPVQMPAMAPSAWAHFGPCKTGMTVDIQSAFGPAGAQISSFSNGSFQVAAATDTVNLEHGGGYFIYSFSDSQVQLPETGTAYSESSHTFTLDEGWNMFSNPFCDPVEWKKSDVELKCGGTTQDDGMHDIYNYSGDGYTRTTVDSGIYIMPWSAYWIFSPEIGCTLTITEPQ